MSKVQTKYQVQLTDPTFGIQIFGELRLLKNFAEIRGIAVGLSVGNYLNYRPDRLTGTSSTLGRIWIDRIFAISPTVHSDDSRPSTIIFKSLAVYWGDFDPLEKNIARVQLSLDGIQPVTLENLTTTSPSDCGAFFITRALNRISSLELFRGESYSIHIAQVPTISRVVEYKQWLTVDFQSETNFPSALNVVDQILTFLSFVLNTRLVPNEIKMHQAGKTSVAWVPGGRRLKQVMPWEYYVDDCEIASFLQLRFGLWLQNTENAELLALLKAVLGVRHSPVAIEHRFLTYCQAFEELSRRRIGDTHIDPDIFCSTVLDAVSAFVSQLQVASEVKRRVQFGVKISNSLSLSERIRKTFRSNPHWKVSVKRSRNDIGEQIERRRNQLSHGNPSGLVLNQSQANEYFIHQNYMFLHCLAEVFFLAGIDEAKVHAMLDGCAVAGDLMHLNRKTARSDS